MNLKYRLAVLLLIVVFAAISIFIPTAQVFADSQTCSLTMHYEHEGVHVPNVTVKIYRVATVDSVQGYKLDDAYANSGVDLSSIKTDSQLTDAADKLAAFANENSISPTSTGVSNVEGDAKFTSLKTGVYLVVSTPTAIGSDTYAFSSYLITLPEVNKNGQAVYDVTSSPKSSLHTEIPNEIPPEQPVPPTPEKLAETGDSLWTVLPVLAISGLILFGIGWKLRSNAKRHKSI